MKKVMVTGGCGYIGSHTIIDLIECGFEVISVDNLSKGSLRMLDGVEKITGKAVKNYKVDLCNLEDTEAIFAENPDLIGVIHFAAFKSVPESVQQPLKYFRNNINSLVNLLDCAQEFDITNFIFSSSCSVYGNVDKLPVDEQTALGEPQSPYARTKKMGESICRDFSNRYENFNTVLLRYFNPVGAHPSALLGELQETPENLVPVITQTAIGIRKQMAVYGFDYDTRDGSCVRDYIHVVDIARAHTQALQMLIEGKQNNNSEVFNLGSGQGVTVFELIHAFESVSGQKLNYVKAARRAGDVVAIYADHTKAAHQLGWKPKYSILEMMDTAWRWEQQLKKEKQSILN